MRRVITFLTILLVSGIVAAGCGKDEGGKPSAKSQLDKLQPADVSDPVVLADAAGNAVAWSQMGADMSSFSMGTMNAMRALKIPVLKGSRLHTLQYGGGYECTGDQNHSTCTFQCEYGGSVTLECSGSETSGSCKITSNNCKDSADEPPVNGYVQLNAKQGSGGSVTITMSIDVTQGNGFVYGSYNITFTPSGTGGTIKQTLDITGADYSDPSDVGYIYFDETIAMEQVGSYGFKITANGNGEFGTTKEGKVSVAINNVVIDSTVCWSEPTSGTITVSAGGSSVTVTFDGETNCDGKAKCSGAYTGEIDISGSSEPVIDF